MAAHKHAEIIKAWADGADIHFRTWMVFPGEEAPSGWSGWRLLPGGYTPTRTDLQIEYRIASAPEPHKWQKEREAFLAGQKVEFCNPDPEVGDDAWHVVDSWLDAFCRSAAGGGRSIWDTDELQFRLANATSRVVEWVSGRRVQYTYEGGHLMKAEVI